jgi:hypothetical protein
VVDRRFWVGDGRQADFEVVFGPDGIWKDLLSKARGYLDTEIECESPVEGRYRVRDFWKSHLGFEEFRERFVVEYEKLDRLMVAEGLIEKQQLVGEYYSGEGSDGDGLVSTEG